MYLKETKVAITFQEALTIIRRKDPELFEKVRELLNHTALDMYQAAGLGSARFVFQDEFVAARRSLVWGTVGNED